MRRAVASILICIIVLSDITVPVALAATTLYNGQETASEEAAVQQEKPKEEKQHSVITKTSSEVLGVFDITPANASASQHLPMKVHKLDKKDYQTDEEVKLSIANPDHEAFQAKVFNGDGKEIAVQIEQVETAETSELSIHAANQIKPGKYSIIITDSEGKQTKQDFNWGVLAFNTDKATYKPNEEALLALGVLDHKGNMVCDAEVTVAIATPDNRTDTLSTKDATIKVNDNCRSTEYTLKPDYEATYKTGGAGTYAVKVTAKTPNGTYVVNDSFSVKSELDFSIKRTSATRIYPPTSYPMEIEITADKDFTGTITETVPASFEITAADTNSYDTMETMYLNGKNPSEALEKKVLSGSDSLLEMPFNDTYRITQGFGHEVTDFSLKTFYSDYGLSGHDGVDFALPIGTPIFAVDEGTILHAGPGDYGITVVIEHSWGRSYYGHLSKTSVEKGFKVTKGAHIGYSGNTGESTGPHLHFGIKPKSADTNNGYVGKVDPLPFLPKEHSGASTTLSLDEQKTVLGATDSAQIEIPAPTEEHSASNAATFTVSDQIAEEVKLSQNLVTTRVKLIQWKVSLKKGESTKLSYTYKAPNESPQFYLTGPLTFFDETMKLTFEEGRTWQIAADAVGVDWYDYYWNYRKEVTIDSSKVGSSGAAGWCNIATGATCNTNWTARRKITFNNTASGTNLTNFPVLVVLNSSRIDYAKTQAAGQDLRFVDADGTTLLSHEIEEFNESGSDSVWVKVPQIDAGSATDYIWMYYGNAGASDGQSGTNVWDSNYRIVHHLNESGSPYQDATSNNKDGSGTNAPTATTGKVAGGQNFIRANSDEYSVTTPNLPTGDFTYSFWVNATTFSGGLPRGVISSASSGPDNQHEIAMSYNTTMDAYTNNTYRFNDGGGTSTGTWYYFSYTRSGGNLAIFRNGVSVNTWSSDSTAFTFLCNLVVGNTYWGCSLSNGNFLDAKLDELRVSAIARSADWIEAEYLSMNDSMNSFGTEEGASAGWCNIATGATCNTSWTARRKITIDNSASGTNLTNFPLLVLLNSSRIDYAKTQAAGQDLRFVDADGTTLLSHEIEEFNESGNDYVWVKVPQINTGSADFIWMYFGNAGASDGQDATNVWDTNYKGIWHMNYSGTTVANDSTTNNNDGNKRSATEPNLYASGAVGAAQDFDGGTAGNDYLTVPNSASLQNITESNHTFSAWANPDTVPPANDRYVYHIVGKYGSSVGLLYYSNQYYIGNVKTGGGTNFNVNNLFPAIAPGNWKYITMTVNDTTKRLRLYVDGVFQQETTYTGTLDDQGTSPLEIGRNRADVNCNDASFYPMCFDGKIDEVRASSTNRSDDWIEAEYRSMTDVMNSFGSEEGQGGSSVNLVNFPVLINLSSDSDLASKAQIDADDILFTDSTGTVKIPHEIESYNSGTGALAAWVKPANITSSSDTVLYMYYGNPSVASQQNAANVWDANYRGVWHLKEDPSGTAPQMRDSTSNALHLATVNPMTSGQQVAGKVNGSLDFDGSNDWLNRADNSLFEPTGDMTFSVWLKADVVDSSSHKLIYKQNLNSPYYSYNIELADNPNKINFNWMNDLGQLYNAKWNVTPSTGTWYYVSGVHSGTSLKIYINGSDSNTISATTTRTMFLSDYPFHVGGLNSNLFNGILDEVRLSGSARSVDWIVTEYNNQSSPGTFYSLGPEETRLGSIPLDRLMRHGKHFDNQFIKRPYLF